MNQARVEAYQQKRRQAGVAQAILDRIELRGMLSAFELVAQVHAVPGGEWGVIILCRWDPWDVETEAVRPFRTCVRLPDVSERCVLMMAHSLLEATLAHELGELLVFDGERPFYPHDPEDPLTNDPFILER